MMEQMQQRVCAIHLNTLVIIHTRHSLHSTARMVRRSSTAAIHIASQHLLQQQHSTARYTAAQAVACHCMRQRMVHGLIQDLPMHQPLSHAMHATATVTVTA
jgi:hypothetical protein